MSKSIHYSGGIRAQVGAWFKIRLAGWPACLSGRAAENCPASRLSTDAAAVTCKRCLKLVAAQQRHQAETGAS